MAAPAFTSKDRLADLVLRRAKRCASETLSQSTLSESELRGIIKKELSEGHHVKEIVGKVARMTPVPTATAAPATPAATQIRADKPAHGAAPAEKQSAPAPSSMQEQMKALQSPPRFHIAPTPHIPVKGAQEKVDLWAVLAKQKDDELVEIRAKARASHNEKLAQQKRVLDEQCALRKTRRTDARAAHLAERTVVDAQKKAWDNETRTNVEAHKQVALQIRAEREEQVSERQHRKQELHREHQAVDASILARMHAELDAEKRKEQAAKEQQVRFREELIRANEEQKARVAERKRHEAELDQLAHRAFIERVEREAKERNDAFMAMKARMKGREALALALQATMDERAADDEVRAKRESDRRYQALVDREHAEAEKRKRGELLVREFRAKQLELKRQEADEELKLKSEERSFVDSAVRESIRALRERKAEERAKHDEFRRTLEAQMLDNEEFHLVKMSQEEIKLNSGMLQRAATSMGLEPTSLSPALSPYRQRSIG